MRRVITARDEAGNSEIVDDGPPQTVVRFGPGFEIYELWRIDEAPTSVAAGQDPERYSFEPDQGALFRAVVIPPDADVHRSLERGDKWGENSPYRVTGDEYGLHGTDTIDFVSVVSGHIAVQMPDGSRSELGPGDAVVQRGAVHSWRNSGPEPAVLHVAMIGTRHRSSIE